MNHEESSADAKAEAIAYARKNREHIARELTDIQKYTPDAKPISVFMAGSPGAGKTEFSKRLISIFEKDSARRILRIDADDLRSLFPNYNGKNSSVFHSAVSLIVEKIHDRVLRNSQSFILDGTFSKFVVYVYQKPEVAWRFTKEREKIEEVRDIMPPTTTKSFPVKR